MAIHVQNPEMAEELRDLLGIEQIAAADDTTYEVIPVPEWGGKVRIGTINAGTMLEYVKANDTPAKINSGLRMIIDSLVDASGRRIGEMKHLEVLKKKNNLVINKIANRILKLNGVGVKPLDFTEKFEEAGTDAEKLKAVVALLNSTAEQITKAGTDKEKLKAIAEGQTEAETKNSSGETPESVSPSD